MVAPVATRRSGWSLAFALAGALHPVEATAKVASAPLAEVVAGAAVIVVAKDVAVRKVGKVRVGRAAVVRVLKGDPHLKEVLYLADPTWACDTAEVKVGQRSLLLLRDVPKPGGPLELPDLPTRIGDQPILQIHWAGRGRMPIRRIDGQEFATVWDEVILPKEIEQRPGPNRKYEFIRSARLQDLIDAIDRALGAPR